MFYSVFSLCYLPKIYLRNGDDFTFLYLKIFWFSLDKGGVGTIVIEGVGERKGVSESVGWVVGERSGVADGEAVVSD